MADTTFQSGTIIASDWLNDINDFFYDTCGGQDGGGITQVLNGAGTVSAPSYSFLADPDSGLYSVSANAMAMVAGGDLVTCFTGVTDSVNTLTIENAITADYPALYPQGSDSNIGLIFDTKGTGPHQFRTGLTGSNLQALIMHVASAVNYLTLRGAVTTGTPQVTATGTDTNVSLGLTAKGTGSLFLRTNGGTSQCVVTDTASAVNYVVLSGSATGTGVKVAAGGTDANVDLRLVPQGTGVVSLGTHSALAAETVTGYITIKDSGGTSRKIAVVS